MFIKEFQIKNFKSISDTTITFNQTINLFTGINNSGKTTVLEAVALWSECFQKLLQKAKRAVPAKQLAAGDFRLGLDIQNYVPLSQLYSVKIHQVEDLFYQQDRNNGTIFLSAVIVKCEEEKPFNCAFEIKGLNGLNFDIYLSKSIPFDYPHFNKFFQTWPRPIQAFFSTPIAAISHQPEEFQTELKVRSMIDSRQSVTVIRNRLFQLNARNNVLFGEFKRALNQIVYDSAQGIEFFFEGDSAQDLQLEVLIQLHAKDISKPLSTVGSGTLQLIEILLHFFERESDLNLILLDEPDSHIHRDLQLRLLQFLNSRKKAQILLSTHNESLIRATPPA